MSINSDNPFAQRCLPNRPFEAPKLTEKAKAAHQVRRRIELLEERYAWEQEWQTPIDETTLQ
jgi:hypothetical protein